VNTRIFVLCAGVSLASLSGCVAVPVHHPVAVVEPGPVYVAPTYESPGVGWVWMYHPHYGWGWHHPELGWHRGWN
jgi:hypothetical protein